MLSSCKDLKKLLREAEGVGWSFVRSNGGHIIGKHSDGIRRTTISTSASEFRALQNIRRDLGVRR